MPYNIAKVTVVLEVWSGDLTWGNPPQYVRRRISFDVPVTDTTFYDAARERWSIFAQAVWDGGPQFNEVSQEAL